jgi:hypothetical protein
MEGINLYKSIIPIPPCSRFRYFEIEVIENKNDSAIFLGIIEEKDLFLEQLSDIDQLNGK